MLNSASPLMTEANYKCKQLPIHMTHPMWLWYMRMICSFGAQSSFGSGEYLKKNTHPLIFSEDWLIQSSEKWQIFKCPLIKSINAQQNMYSIQKKIPAVFGLRKSPEYEYEYYSIWKYRPNTNTNILVFEYYSNNIRIPNYSLTSASSPEFSHLQGSAFASRSA